MRKPARSKGGTFKITLRVPPLLTCGPVQKKCPLFGKGHLRNAEASVRIYENYFHSIGSLPIDCLWQYNRPIFFTAAAGRATSRSVSCPGTFRNPRSGSHCF